MKTPFTVLCLVFALFATACEPKPAPEEEVVQVDLASDGVLEASFMSVNGSFSYRFEYDGELLQMMEGEGVQFAVLGGASIDAQTVWLSEVVEETDLAGAPSQVGAYQVYRYMDSEGACALHQAIVPYDREALLLTLRVCDGQDGEVGRQALDQLLEGLTIQPQ